MKRYQLMGISIVIGAILAASSTSYQEAHATEIDDVMMKMIEVDSKLSNLKNADGNFDESAMGKISFKIKQVQDVLLEINDVNDKDNDKINEIYEQLKINYIAELEKYQKDVKDYQKENGLTMQEKKLVAGLLKNKMTFENNESQQNFKKTQQKLIDVTIKESKIKENYQKLINKIGVKLANEANGSKVQKIHHKIAIQEIISSNSWELAIPAIDRIITQTNSDEMVNRLIEIKTDIKELLENKEKEDAGDQIFVLKSNDEVKEIDFIDVEEIVIESLINSEKIFSEFEKELEQSYVSQIIESNTLKTITPIFDDELIQSLVEVSKISDEDDNEQEVIREKQAKEKKEKSEKKEKLEKKEKSEKKEKLEKKEKKK